MLRNLNCPIISCLWVMIMMISVLIIPLFRCLANLSLPPKISKKSNICQKTFHFANFRLVTPPKPPRRTTPTRSVERPKISTVLLPTYSNNVNTNNTNNTNNTMPTPWTSPASQRCPPCPPPPSWWDIIQRKKRFPINTWIIIMIVRCVIPTRGERRC